MLLHYQVLNEILVLNPDNKPQELNWNEWCATLKITARANQKGRCGYCNKNIIGSVFDLHHALLTRRDVMKNTFGWKIHHTYNCLALCRDCHSCPTKERSAEVLLNLYGEEVIKWYNSFELKYNKPKIFEKGIKND